MNMPGYSQEACCDSQTLHHRSACVRMMIRQHARQGQVRLRQLLQCASLRKDARSLLPEALTTSQSTAASVPTVAASAAPGADKLVNPHQALVTVAPVGLCVRLASKMEVSLIISLQLIAPK